MVGGIELWDLSTRRHTLSLFISHAGHCGTTRLSNCYFTVWLIALLLWNNIYLFYYECFTLNTNHGPCYIRPCAAWLITYFYFRYTLGLERLPTRPCNLIYSSMCSVPHGSLTRTTSNLQATGHSLRQLVLTKHFVLARHSQPVYTLKSTVHHKKKTQRELLYILHNTKTILIHTALIVHYHVHLVNLLNYLFFVITRFS